MHRWMPSIAMRPPRWQLIGQRAQRAIPNSGSLSAFMDPLRRTLLALSSALLARQALARAPVKPSPPARPLAVSVPGGIARVPLGDTTTPPQAWLGNRRVLVLREDAGWVALIGIALAEKAGNTLALTVQ